MSGPTREEAADLILSAKRLAGLTWQARAKQIGISAEQLPNPQGGRARGDGTGKRPFRNAS